MTTAALPRPHDKPLKFDNSAALLKKARSRVAGLTLSMMKRPEHFCEGRFPVFLDRGSGALVTDVDGNEYIDFICGLGGNALGHADPAWLDAVQGVLGQGVLHSLPHSLEAQVADALVECIPGAEMARLFKTGADATSAAVRLARHLTGREKVVTVGYNGWHDHFMFDTPGVPNAVASLTTRLPLFVPENERQLLEHLEREGRETAALLLSVPYNRVLDAEFLGEVRRVCSEQGVLLVFDEIVTGFRVALGGVEELFGVTPDLSTYSKAFTGGMPLSALVGPRRHMESIEALQVSTTFGGELLALSSALNCIRQFQERKLVNHMGELGRHLREGVNQVAEEVGSPLRVIGYDAIPLFCFDREMPRHVEQMRMFQGEMAERGVLLRRDVNFFTAAHSLAQIDFTVEAARESLAAMRGS